MNEPGGVGLLKKTFQVLEMFKERTPSWAQAELVRETGMNRSTLSRVVRYLESTGYLMFNDETNKYTLGIAAVELGRRANATFDLRQASATIVEKLSKATRETAILTSYKPGDDFVTCLDQVHAGHGGLSVFEKLGAQFPLHAGAAPKAVLLALSPEKRQIYYAKEMKRFTEATIVDPVILQKNIEEYAVQKYAISREETYPGVIGVAAPIIVGKSPIGSLALSVPLQRTTDEKIAEWGKLVVTATEEISHRIQGQKIDQNAESTEASE